MWNHVRFTRYSLQKSLKSLPGSDVSANKSEHLLHVLESTREKRYPGNIYAKRNKYGEII